MLDPSDHSTPSGKEGDRLELVTAKQVSDFKDAYSAACLDSAPLPKHFVEAVNASNPQMTQMIQMLQRSRAKEMAENKALRTQLDTAERNVFNAMKELRREKKETEDKLRDELKAGRKQNEEIRGLGKQELDARQAEIERLQQEVNKKACEQNRSSKAYDRLVAKVEEMKRQETAKTTLHNAALDKLKADNVKLQARFDKAVSEASSQRSRMEQDHAKLVMRQQTLHTDTLDKLKATVASKERIINQLSENNERRDVEVASLTTHDEEQAATIVRLQQEIAALTADAQKSTSVATSMRNASTATHHCASTQDGAGGATNTTTTQGTEGVPRRVHLPDSDQPLARTLKQHKQRRAPGRASRVPQLPDAPAVSPFHAQRRQRHQRGGAAKPLPRPSSVTRTRV